MVNERQGREGESREPQQSFEKSDALTVPTCKKSTNSRVTPEESMEGRSAAYGKSASRNTRRAQNRESVTTNLKRIGQYAKQRKGERFNNLLNHIQVPLLEEAYMCLRKDAAPGVDGVTWRRYGEHLDVRLCDLTTRIHRGSYHPQPVRRVHIPKGDGRTRPLGIPSLEDKIVQQAARMILEPIYEQSFLGFSHGFRPGRSQHMALDALAYVIRTKKVNWVLDTDIRSFYDTIDHGWLKKFIEHTVADRRMVRLLMKWLHAGVMEDGELREVHEGAPQGGGISPLLSNIYLHFALDLWVSQWRKRHARGEVYFVRFADDVVMAFQYEQDARAMREALADRLAKFGLELHSEKTRVMRFGRFALEDERRRGLRPATFDFLGLTHIAGKTRGGGFLLQRRTSRKKRVAKLKLLREEMRARMHDPPHEQHGWLCSVLRGHYQYYGVPTNYRAMASFRDQVQQAWHRQLQRRSQRAEWTARERQRFQTHFRLPTPRIVHPWPEARITGP
jgi:group II intron reverse transcriptase/maturase